MSSELITFVNTGLVPIGLMLIMFSMGLTLKLGDFGCSSPIAGRSWRGLAAS